MPVFGVQVQVLPVSVPDSVFDAVAPVSVSVAVLGAHESVPRSPLRVVAFARSVVIAAENVPVPSFALMAIEPDAVARAPAKLVPVPVSSRASA